MVRNVVVVDAGESIVGVYGVAEAVYTAYRGKEMIRAVLRVQEADELVTYNGNRYDLKRLSEIAAQSSRQFVLSGEHSDMQDICWGNILGSNLYNTYVRCVGSQPPAFPETYQGSNELDVYMTHKLWQLWCARKLMDIHGRIIPYRTA